MTAVANEEELGRHMFRERLAAVLLPLGASRFRVEVECTLSEKRAEAQLRERAVNVGRNAHAICKRSTRASW